MTTKHEYDKALDDLLQLSRAVQDDLDVAKWLLTVVMAHLKVDPPTVDKFDNEDDLTSRVRDAVGLLEAALRAPPRTPEGVTIQ